MKGLPGHDPPARSAAPRVPPARAEADRGARRDDGRAASRRSSSAIEELHEFNPMLGHRGCRLAITFPEIYAMQVRAILEAALRRRGRGRRRAPRDHDPARDDAARSSTRMQAIVDARRERGLRRDGPRRSPFLFGTMIELPRAALRAGELARDRRVLLASARTISRRRTMGLSRDDAGKFLPALRRGGHPRRRIRSSSIDVDGVGALVKLAVRARPQTTRRTSSSASAASTAAIRTSIRFFHEVGLDYVSCSPFRVPIARLAAAQARPSRRAAPRAAAARREGSAGGGGQTAVAVAVDDHVAVNDHVKVNDHVNVNAHQHENADLVRSVDDEVGRPRGSGVNGRSTTTLHP